MLTGFITYNCPYSNDFFHYLIKNITMWTDAWLAKMLHYEQLTTIYEIIAKWMK